MLFEDEDLWLKMSNSAKRWATRFSLEKISEEWNFILNSLIMGDISKVHSYDNF